jgi:hypothetical protein
VTDTVSFFDDPSVFVPLQLLVHVSGSGALGELGKDLKALELWENSLSRIQDFAYNLDCIRR